MSPISLESEPGAPSDRVLLLRGLACIGVVAIVVAALILKSTGALDDRVTITALLGDIGDGLPTKSDVKYRGLLVGMVTGVRSGQDGASHRVEISLEPGDAEQIPNTVTARVVPSNVFAVSSVQLVDNGDGVPVRAGAVVRADTGLATVELQTALTTLRDIVAAVSRDRDDSTIGMLAALAAATETRGGQLRRTGAQLIDIVSTLNTVLGDGSSRSLLQDLAASIRGLETAAPDLLDALNDSITSTRTVAEKDAALTDLLGAGQHTMTLIQNALLNNTDQMMTITRQAEPVLDVIARGGPNLAPMMTRIALLSNKFMDVFWDPERQRGTGFFVWSLSPHRVNTRADCPRYGAMEGSSCSWAPEAVDTPTLAPSMDPRNYAPPVALAGGNVGAVGSPAEAEFLEHLLGRQVGDDAGVLLGRMLLGMPVTTSVPAATPAGGPR